ncbi:hypothetical protein DS843_08790 [Roseomonas genomospecies 6]|uniref:Uncharacterized protein n=1 Tax=Roseomonas genomospecies 6 TaxID=214106 RepID=A0A9W7TZW9_9PROT|nr:hypothetical protein DS843_08790 [Roseomonas genomospecies 6]
MPRAGSAGGVAVCVRRGVGAECVAPRAGRQGVEQGQRLICGLGIAFQTVERSHQRASGGAGEHPHQRGQRTGSGSALGGVQVAEEGAEAGVSGQR